MKKIITLLICCIVGISTAIAGDHPQAHFGDFGLAYFSSAEGYQKYVGEVVSYIPEQKPSFEDKKFINEFKGKFNTPYVIQKVSGDTKKIKFEMVEKNAPKTKIKFEFLNYDEYYSYGKKTFCNTEKYRVPLFFIEKFAAAAAEFKEKQLKAQDDTYLTIKGLTFAPSSDAGYPVVCYQIYNPLSDKTNNVPVEIIDNYTSIIGKVYSDPECNFTYTVTSFENTKRNYGLNKTIWQILNSATGKIEETEVSDYGHSVSVGDGPAEFVNRKFREAKGGYYVATLSKVEKPSNSAIRYGKTTEIKDADKNLTKFSYVDNIIDILIFATNYEFSFELKNISPNSIKVIWDEAVFVDASGSTSKVMHVGTKYSERNGSQPPTTLIKTAKIEDVATPTDRVYYSDDLKKWTSKSMMPEKSRLKGQQIRLMLPIQIKDVVNEYVFVFNLNYVLNHPELLVNPDF